MPQRIDPDPELATVSAIRNGDAQAFGGFMRRHSGWVRGVVFGVLGDRETLDDATQQVWTQVWDRIRELRDVRRWKPWLYRLARNTALDAGRGRTRRRRLVRSACAAAAPPTIPAPDDALIEDERRTAVYEAIGSLPAMYREPFVLRHLDGWSYRQIGDVLDLPVDTVETRLVRARRRLRDALKDKL